MTRDRYPSYQRCPKSSHDPRDCPAAVPFAAPVIRIQGNNMTRVSGETRWGATVDDARDADSAPRNWLVEVESDSLGPTVADETLSRFATRAKHIAPHAAAKCSMTLGRLRMTLKIAATSPHKAADTGEDVFAQAFETAVWPRSSASELVEYTVRVKPADEYPYAA